MPRLSGLHCDSSCFVLRLACSAPRELPLWVFVATAFTSSPPSGSTHSDPPSGLLVTSFEKRPIPEIQYRLDVGFLSPAVELPPGEMRCLDLQCGPASSFFFGRGARGPMRGRLLGGGEGGRNLRPSVPLEPLFLVRISRAFLLSGMLRVNARYSGVRSSSNRSPDAVCVVRRLASGPCCLSCLAFRSALPPTETSVVT